MRKKTQANLSINQIYLHYRLSGRSKEYTGPNFYCGVLLKILMSPLVGTGSTKSRQKNLNTRSCFWKLEVAAIIYPQYRFFPVSTLSPLRLRFRLWGGSKVSIKQPWRHVIFCICTRELPFKGNLNLREPPDKTAVNSCFETSNLHVYTAVEIKYA